METLKERRNKFTHDPEYNLFSLGGLLAEGLAFPFDFGSIPSTHGGDGDQVGCLLDISIIGVMEAVQTEKKRKTVKRAAELLETGIRELG